VDISTAKKWTFWTELLWIFHFALDKAGWSRISALKQLVAMLLIGAAGYWSGVETPGWHAAWKSV
jgi:hypothetical protein